MKRLIFATIVAISLLAGCGKEESGSQLDTRLVGTSYQTDGYKALMQALYGSTYRILEFTSATKGVAYWTDAKGVQNGSDGEFTYTLNYPSLTATFAKSVEKFQFKDERTFVFIKDDGTPNNSITYYKK